MQLSTDLIQAIRFLSTLKKKFYILQKMIEKRKSS